MITIFFMSTRKKPPIMVSILFLLFSLLKSTKRKATNDLLDKKEQKRLTSKKLKQLFREDDSILEIKEVEINPIIFLNNTKTINRETFMVKEVELYINNNSPSGNVDFENITDNNLKQKNNNEINTSLNEDNLRCLDNYNQYVLNPLFLDSNQYEIVDADNSTIILDEENCLDTKKIIKHDHNYAAEEKIEYFDNGIQNDTSDLYHVKLAKNYEDVENEEFLEKIIEQTKLYSSSGKLNIKFPLKIEEFLGNTPMRNIYHFEKTTLFRFYYYFKCKYEVSLYKIKIFDEYGNKKMKKMINMFLEDYVINDFFCVSKCEELTGPDNVKMAENKQIPFNIKSYMIDFNNFIQTQGKKFCLLYAHYNGGNFFISTLKNVSCIDLKLKKKFILYALKKVLEKKENLFITYLFPEILVFFEIITKSKFLLKTKTIFLYQ